MDFFYFVFLFVWLVFVLADLSSGNFVWFLQGFFHLLLLVMEGKKALIQERFEEEAFNLIHIKYR